MKLTAVQLERFRNFVDSGEVEIQPDVTCLVGKNESGKTAFLRGLYKLRPAIKGHRRFNLAEDYPRWRWKTDQRSGEIDTTTPVTATFELDDDDVAAVEAAFGPGCVKSRKLNLSRTYGSDNFTWNAPKIEEAAVVTHLCAGISQPNPLRFDPSTVTSLTQLADVLQKLPERPKPPAVEEGQEPAEIDPVLLGFHDAIDQIAERLTTLTAEGGSGLTRELWSLLEPRIPTFFYFDEYSRLPGRIDVKALLAKNEDDLESDERTALALIRLALVDESGLQTDDYEPRVAELEAAANEITRQVFDYWSQNRELRVSFDIDKRIEERPDAQPREVARYLDVRLHDARHLITTNFGTRSSGFQWFFSFIAAFSTFEDRKQPVVVLLDEPALALHARAQADFLRFIEERLATRHQVIYTTHSPFMIDAKELRRVRLVEDHGKDGASITKDVLTTDADTVFPLQAALGYDMTQNLFVGANNVVVEGTSDLIYVSELARHLSGLSRGGLDLTKFTIVPVGGATKVPSFVALLGTKLNVTVLVDAEANLNQQLTSMISKGRLPASRLITVAQVMPAGTKQADIEDLFEASEYLGLYNAAFNSSVSPDDLSGKGPIVKQIEAFTKSSFDHGKPAEQLLRDPDAFLPQLSEACLQRFEKLFGLIADSAKS